MRKNKVKIENGLQNPAEMFRALQTYSVFLIEAIAPEYRKDYYIAITADEYGKVEFELKEQK